MPDSMIASVFAALFLIQTPPAPQDGPVVTAPRPVEANDGPIVTAAPARPPVEPASPQLVSYTAAAAVW